MNGVGVAGIYILAMVLAPSLWRAGLRGFSARKHPAPWMPSRSRGMPMVREIGTSDVHAYQVMLSTGEFMRVVVDQRGIDVGCDSLRPRRRGDCRS